MKILYVASEAAPYAASGGLGDVMGALPASIKKLGGKDTVVSVILPLYRSIADEYRKKMKKIDEFHFYLGWRHAYCGVFEIKAKNVRYLFLDNEYYFYRDQLYGDFDDGERFAYFSRAVVEYIRYSGDVPDILHANDWQSALSIIYLKTKYREDSALSRIKTVFTIHNIEYQGKYDVQILSDVFDLDPSYLPYVEYEGAINLLKGAVATSDAVSTVSENYAKELHNPYFSFGLSPIIDMFGHKMKGIVNGIDLSYFNPNKKNDCIIPFTQTRVREGKAANKKALQESLGLPVDENIPLISMVTRLTAGKGIDLVLHIFEELMEENIQFVILGTGEENYERIFSLLAARHGDRARAILRFDRNLSKQIYASSDLFLMPSKSEPCGLAQMIACRYGTLPVVHGVGGLKDTIIPYGEKNANGFVFENFNAHELLFTIKHALAIKNDNADDWTMLVKQAMKTDFSWDASAQKNLDLYAKIIGEKL